MLKQKHIESKNKIVVEIFAKFTYKIVLFFNISTTIKIFEIVTKCARKMIIFSNMSTIVETFEIFVVFVYKIVLFFDVQQRLEFWNNCKMCMQNNHFLEHVNKNQYIWNICNFRIQIDFVFRQFENFKNVQIRNLRINIRFRHFEFAKQLFDIMQLRRKCDERASNSTSEQN